jgi:N-acetylneuraminic acid mutarotase
VLSLDGFAPTSATAKYQDSPSIKFSGGNVWKVIGTWTAAASVVTGSLTTLGPVDGWIGLKNSDDIGTRFDIRVEASRNGIVFASGESRCIQGVTRNPDLATEIQVAFDPFAPTVFDGASDVLAVTMSTRIGTTGTGAFCGGHSNALGLRWYFDAATRASRVPVTITPVGDEWTTLAPMLTARERMGVGLVGGLLYAVGGDNNAEPNLGTVEAYDPLSNTWAMKASLGTPRRHLGAAVINGTLYAVGGLAPAGIVGTVEAYDPATDTWATKAAMPTPRFALGVAAINGTLYAVGGAFGAGATVEAYDPGTDTWAAKASLPTPRGRLGVAALNGMLYAIGGFNGSTSLATVEAYDPITNTWATKAPMPTPRAGLGVAAVNGKLYAIGGIGDLPPTMATVEVYDPATDTWATKAPMPTARTDLGVGVLNGLIYALGGIQTGDVLATVEVYQP